MKRETKILLKSLVPLLIIIFLFVVVGKIGVFQTKNIRSKSLEASELLSKLEARSQVLSKVEENSDQFVDNVSVYLPDENSSATLISQLKKLSSLIVVNISNIKSANGTSDKLGLKRVDMSFDLLGTRSQIFIFLDNIPTIAPITQVEKVKINESGGVVRANIHLKSYWAELPTKLPGLTESFADFSDSDMEILSGLDKLILPSFTSLPPADDVNETNPFRF